MEVYRLKPDPTYLGTIQILAVRPNEAVAKPINRTRVPISISFGSPRRGFIAARRYGGLDVSIGCTARSALILRAPLI